MMRKAKILILTCIISLITINVNAQKGNSYDWNPVMNAIIQVESKGNKNARSKDCVGAMQIRPVLVQDVNEYLKVNGNKKRYTLNDRYSVEKSKEMFILYQERYNPTNNVDKAIRLWNGGPGYSISKTNGYLNKVKAHMK